MPASAATTGRTAASLRAAIALSAEVSVATIQNHADVASVPSNEFEAMAPELSGERSTTGSSWTLPAQRPAAAQGRGGAHNIIPTATRGARSLERVDEMLGWQAQGESGAKRRVSGLGDLPCQELAALPVRARLEAPPSALHHDK